MTLTDRTDGLAETGPVTTPLLAPAYRWATIGMVSLVFLAAFEALAVTTIMPSVSGDLDGRGNLTQAGLAEFCKFFLKTAIDQIDFMTALLDLDGMQKRIQAVVDRQVSLGELKPEAGHLLRDVFLRGEIARGEIPKIIGMPERSARRVVVASWSCPQR